MWTGDWRSDVCSSDLGALSAGTSSTGATGLAGAGYGSTGSIIAAAVSDSAGAVVAGTSGATGTVVAASEIGRAPWRERVQTRGGAFGVAKNAEQARLQ